MVIYQIICLIEYLVLNYSILSCFKTSVTELICKLIAQGLKLAALHNKFVKFYESKLNIWGKYGNDIYDEFIEMFQSSNIIL